MLECVALQGLHSVAFTGGLSKPLVAPPGVAARLTPPVLADFIASNYGAQRMVLAGANDGARCRRGHQHGMLANQTAVAADRPRRQIRRDK